VVIEKSPVAIRRRSRANDSSASSPKLEEEKKKRFVRVIDHVGFLDLCSRTDRSGLLRLLDSGGSSLKKKKVLGSRRPCEWPVAV
jgi:hypothetical protein